MYRELRALMPAWAHLSLLLGHSLKAVRRQPEAIESYQAALIARPGFGDAYWSLANLKTYRFSDHEIACMRAAETAEINTRRQIEVCTAQFFDAPQPLRFLVPA